MQYLLYYTEFYWIYIKNMFLKFRIIDGEYIVKISRGVVRNVYEATTFRSSKEIQNIFKVLSS